MFWHFIMLFGGLVLLTAGAEGLVRGSASIASRLGLSPLVIGLTIVAFGTSAPELVVSIRSSLVNQADITIGNVVGSNIFNIGIILGLTALICPIKINLQVLKSDGPIMVLSAIIALALISKSSLTFFAGLTLLFVLFAYTFFTILAARRVSSPAIAQEFSEGIPTASKSFLQDLFFILAGFVFLIGGSQLLVTSATAIALIFGVSQAVIGLTIVAAGTSMPELVVSVVAALRAQPDIAVGNVIGSNIFNILGILGAAAIINPITTTAVTTVDLWVMVIFSITLLPLLYTDFELKRWEGMVLLFGYGAYLWHLWPL